MFEARTDLAVKVLESLSPADEQLCKLGLLVASDDLVEGLAPASCGLVNQLPVGVRRGAPTRVCELPLGITRLGLLFIYSPGREVTSTSSVRRSEGV